MLFDKSGLEGWSTAALIVASEVDDSSKWDSENGDFLRVEQSKQMRFRIQFQKKGWSSGRPLRNALQANMSEKDVEVTWTNGTSSAAGHVLNYRWIV